MLVERLTGKSKQHITQKRKGIMSKLVDLTGKQFGKLTVIMRLENYRQENGRTRTRWLCRCKCGNDYVADGDHLKSGAITSCGCFRREVSSNIGKQRKGITPEYKTVDIKGMIFGELTVLSFKGYKKNKAQWECRCSCGRTCVVLSNQLLSGRTKSCGHLARSEREKEFMKLLDINHIHYQNEYSFPDLKSDSGKPLRFDFAIFDSASNLKSLVELQGTQHYKNPELYSFYYCKPEYDERKANYCDKNGIMLYVIRYDEPLEKYICDLVNG